MVPKVFLRNLFILCFTANLEAGIIYPIGQCYKPRLLCNAGSQDVSTARKFSYTFGNVRVDGCAGPYSDPGGLTLSSYSIVDDLQVDLDLTNEAIRLDNYQVDTYTRFYKTPLPMFAQTYFTYCVYNFTYWETNGRVFREVNRFTLEAIDENSQDDCFYWKPTGSSTKVYNIGNQFTFNSDENPCGLLTNTKGLFQGVYYLLTGDCKKADNKYESKKEVSKFVEDYISQGGTLENFPKCISKSYVSTVSTTMTTPLVCPTCKVQNCDYTTRVTPTCPVCQTTKCEFTTVQKVTCPTCPTVTSVFPTTCPKCPVCVTTTQSPITCQPCQNCSSDSPRTSTTVQTSEKAQATCPVCPTPEVCPVNTCPTASATSRVTQGTTGGMSTQKVSETSVPRSTSSGNPMTQATGPGETSPFREESSTTTKETLTTVLKTFSTTFDPRSLIVLTRSATNKEPSSTSKVGFPVQTTRKSFIENSQECLCNDSSEFMATPIFVTILVLGYLVLY